MRCTQSEVSSANLSSQGLINLLKVARGHVTYILSDVNEKILNAVAGYGIFMLDIKEQTALHKQS